MFFRESYTLNFDGSHNPKANTASAGCIIRDSKGDLFVAAAYNLTNTNNLPYYNVAIAEAKGLWYGLTLAKERSLKLNLIKGDSEEVINLVFGHTMCQRGSPLADIIDKIKVLMIDQRSAKFKHINRTDNKVADKLADIGSSIQTECKVFTKSDINYLPSQLPDLIRRDKTKARTDEEGSSLVTKVSLALAGGLLAFGASMLFSGGTSSADSDEEGSSRVTKVSLALLAGGLLAFGASMLFSGGTSSADSDDSPRSRSDIYTLQYFGSDRNQKHKARAGCIILKNREEFFVAGAYNLNHQYPDCHIAIAEAIALKKGLKLAKDNNVRLNFIQGRNVEVRDRVLDREKRPPRSRELIGFIQQIKYALCEQGVVDLEDTLELVNEESIKVARALATVGGTLDHEDVIYGSVDQLPPSVANLVDG